MLRFWFWDFCVDIIFNNNPYQNALEFLAFGESIIRDRRFAPRNPNNNLQPKYTTKILSNTLQRYEKKGT